MMRAVAAEPADRAVLLLVAGAAVLIGTIAAATSPLVPAAALFGLLIFAVICLRPFSGLWLFVAVVATLPFGVIPVPLGGAQLTLVDVVLIATFVAVGSRLAFGRMTVPLDLPGIALILLAVVAVAAFVAGSEVSPITPELVRRVGKLLASLLFFLIARALLSNPDRLVRLTRWLIVAGAVQAAIGALLMALSPLTQLNLLSRLQAIGYPGSDILRYVPGPNDTYTDQLRAIGTSVDPNVFGGTLMLALALTVVQWASPQPVLRKSTLLVLAVPIAAGVLLSLSRASWLGLAVGLLLVGALRYRRILVLAVLGGLAVVASAGGQAFIGRFVSGFSTSDPATAFRVGEYSNALTLLSRYPLLGIGFGASPDIDVTAGVSSVYLLVAEQTGVLGLAMFVIALLTVWLMGMRKLRDMDDERLQGIRAGFVAALSGALVTGLLDHYFANQAFPHAVALFWLYAAALVSASVLGQREPERAPATRASALRSHRSTV
jgi:O-antigen ligase/polysaccharide polymerase Wzy-like membrane protein